MSSQQKLIRYRLPGDKLIRTCPERLTRTKAWKIQGATIVPDPVPVKLREIPEVAEVLDEEQEAAPEPKRMGRPRKSDAQ